MKNTLKKTLRWRSLILALSLAGMLAAAAFYLIGYRYFIVDDTLYQAEIRDASRKYGIDSRLVRALIYEESRFRAGTIGRAGEIGLMQIMPDRAVADWARVRGVPKPDRSVLFSPKINLEIGCWYLSDGLRRFREYTHAPELALARYNAGLSRANAWKPEKPDGEVVENITIASTKKYVGNIMRRYRNYCEESAVSEKSGK